MFSELMQSTQTERAQQNAWRQTMAESRKAQNECKDRWLELLEDQTDMLCHMVEVQERHRPPLQTLCNQPPSSPSSIASSPRRPRMQGGPPGTRPLHPRGLPKQLKAGIQ
ncbi:unnamed protein product [Lepidochelys olivacea]